MKKYDISIVGATGLVGRTFLKVLEDRDFPIGNLYLYSSARSAGTKISFNNEIYEVMELTEQNLKKSDFALFSAGGSVSKTYAPIFAEIGTIVIDNSSAWRMHPEVPLVVPEVNYNDLLDHKGIIANPNCSTIQLMPILNVLNNLSTIDKVIVSTYQSISGAGQKGLEQLEQESKGIIQSPATKQIYSNAIFHPPSEELPNWTVEEVKMVKESRKILHLPELKFSVTCVRLPIQIGHSESVYIETNEIIDISSLINELSNVQNLVVINDFENGEYPTPIITQDRDEIFVGRIRRDLHNPKGLWLWVVANNLRKGAATNAIQIAEKMIEMQLV